MLQQLTDAQLDRKIYDLESEKNHLKREASMTDGFVTYRGRMLSSVKGKQNSNELELRNARMEKIRRKALTSEGYN